MKHTYHANKNRLRPSEDVEDCVALIRQLLQNANIKFHLEFVLSGGQGGT